MTKPNPIAKGDVELIDAIKRRHAVPSEQTLQTPRKAPQILSWK
jgi:hypothetical protein